MPAPLLVAVLYLSLLLTCPPPKERSVDPLKVTSISQTPPSSIYPYECNDLSRFPLYVPGTEGLNVTDWRNLMIVARQQIELRGWIVSLPDNCNGDGDYAFSLEIDPDWTDKLGLKDLNQLIWVGNVMLARGGVDARNLSKTFQPENIPKTYYQAVSPPVVHVEIHPWAPQEYPCAPSSVQSKVYFEATCHKPNNAEPIATPSPCPAATPPPDWLPATDPAFNGDCAIPAGCDRRNFWPYNPRQPFSSLPCLQVGQYVRVFGTLITDFPHLDSETIPPNWVKGSDGPDDFEVKRVWGGDRYIVPPGVWIGGQGADHPNHPARYSEIHPADVIAFVDADRRPSETVVAVAVVAEDSSFPKPGHAPTAQSFDLDIFPPDRPAGANQPSQIMTTEIVDQVATDLHTIKAGNSNRSGAKIDTYADHVHIHVEIEGRPFPGARGRFKAIYRVKWKT